MVVGPLMQGVVLMGIIYWYSKGMISMINDYYRSEFQRKLQEATNDTTLDKPSYDVENFDDLLKVENFIENVEILDINKADSSNISKDVYDEHKVKCNGPKNLAYFMYLIGLNSSEVYVECWSIKQTNFNESISYDKFKL